MRARPRASVTPGFRFHQRPPLLAPHRPPTWLRPLRLDTPLQRFPPRPPHPGAASLPVPASGCTPLRDAPHAASSSQSLFPSGPDQSTQLPCLTPSFSSYLSSAVSRDSSALLSGLFFPAGHAAS